MLKKFSPIVIFILVGIALSACGSQEIEVSKSSAYYSGAQLFQERCGGCHTLTPAATRGTSENVRDRERTDGPNLDYRKETPEQVLYAIRNGGFSGKIMPANIVTGKEAQSVAEFVAKYAGNKK